VLLLATPITVGNLRTDHYTPNSPIPTRWFQENPALDLVCQDGSYYRVATDIWDPKQWHNRATLALIRPAHQLLYGCFGTRNAMRPIQHRGDLFGSRAVVEAREPSDTLPKMRMSSIRWFISDRRWEHPRLTLLGQFEDQGYTVYFHQVQNPMPRAFVPPEVLYAPGRTNVREMGNTPLVEPTELAQIDVGETSREHLAGRREKSGPGQVQITEYRNQRVELAVQMEEPGWVVLSDTFYPGWSASVSGEPAELFQANYLFRGVHVPAGEHTVVFSYFPSRLKVGLLSMAVSLTAAVAVAWFLVPRAPVPQTWGPEQDEEFPPLSRVRARLQRSVAGVKVSSARACPACGSRKVIMRGPFSRALLRAYQCQECRTRFQGVRLLGLRVSRYRPT
jgi:predicted RNA-binding Zn-ribbon protein involved in translation (DUF1610 family)